MYNYYDNLDKNKITVNNNGVVEEKNLPNGYFITPNGYLYNTSTENGHRYNSFVNEYMYIINLLKKNKILADLKNDIKYYQEKLNSIIDFKYIDYESLKTWVESIYELPKNVSLDIDDNKKKLANQEILTTLYKGFCDATINFYNFFYSTFSVNPSKYYDDLNDILGNVNVYDKMVEILVRCIGFHKIELHVGKNITTTSLHPVTDFYEYLINGYNVWVVPSIVNDNGFKETDLNNTIPISSFTAIENFEEENPDKGIVRILGL